MENQEVELVSLVEWAKEKEISQQWACKLCADRRIPGAVFVDNYRWMVPKGSVSPTRKKSARLAAIHEDRARKQREEDERELAMLEQEARERKEWADICSRIDRHVAAGLFIDGGGNVFRVADGRVVVPAVDKFDVWEEREQGHYFSVGGKRKPADIVAPAVVVNAPVAVSSTPTVNPDWPSNEDESGRAYDIREGVMSDPPLTLEQIKAQVKHWGADEQAYYDSLVDGTLNAL